MAKAPVDDQFELLELQQLDNFLAVATRTFEQTLKHPDLATARAKLRAAMEHLEHAQAKVAEEADQEQSIEDQIASVEARIAKDQRALDAGSGSAETLTNLQHEIDSLRAKKAQLEAAELEVMDGSEKHQAELEKAKSKVAHAEKELKNTEDNLRVTLAEVQSKARHTQEERQRIADMIDPELLALYEKIRARNGGLGAARLFKGVSEGSGMRLSPGDLATINKAADDDVVICPDSGVILVRSGDWE